MDESEKVNRNLVIIAVVGTSVLFAVSRVWLGFTMEPDLRPQDIYKDMAHLFTGGLIGAALVSRSGFYWWLAGGLTGVEVVVALAPRVIGWFS